MASAVTETMIRMLEALPTSLQEQTLEHMRVYIEEIQDEMRWEDAYSRSEKSLIAAARQAREAVQAGKSFAASNLGNNPGRDSRD